MIKKKTILDPLNLPKVAFLDFRFVEWVQLHLLGKDLVDQTNFND